jgi:type IV pilus assembly protein PilV
MTARPAASQVNACQADDHSPRGVAAAQRGVTLVEILITMLIVAFGLLGLGGLQMRLQLSDIESYQRAQALALLEDMANRIATNRNKAATYVTGASSALGTGMTCPATSTTVQQADTSQWCAALQGGAEKLGSVKTGAAIGARGCIESIGTNQYLITVAWQGLTPVAAPPASVACGAGLYDTAGTSCTGDMCRRTVTTVLSIATLN